jgi:hypothetical protein
VGAWGLGSIENSYKYDYSNTCIAISSVSTESITKADMQPINQPSTKIVGPRHSCFAIIQRDLESAGREGLTPAQWPWLGSYRLWLGTLPPPLVPLL